MVVPVQGRAIPIDPRWWLRRLRSEIDRTPRALKAWYSVLLLMMAIGAIGALRAVWPGDKALNTTPTVEWGLLIVGYVFFAITTSGLCLASSLGTVFGIDRFRPLEKRHAILAVLCLVSAFGIIAIDLQYPIRLMFGAVFNPSPSSPMWWMGVFYAIYLVFLLIELWSIFWHHPLIHQWACLCSSITAVFAPLTLGAVFAVVAARGYWYGLFTPMLMVSSAFLSGVALLTVVFYFVGRLRLAGWRRALVVAMPALRVLLAIGLIAVGAQVARQLYVGFTSVDIGLRGATDVLLVGPLAIPYVGVRLIGGLALPLLIVLLPTARRPSWLLVAGVLALLGVFVDRLSFVEAGQLAPVTAASGVVSSPYADYMPSLVEVSILVGAVGVVLFMYTLAERYLDLREAEAHTMILADGYRWLMVRAVIARDSAAEWVAEWRRRRAVVEPEEGEEGSDGTAEHGGGS